MDTDAAPVREEVDDDDRLEEKEAVEVVDEEAAPVSDGLADADRLGEKRLWTSRKQMRRSSETSLTTMTGSARRMRSWSWKPSHRR